MSGGIQQSSLVHINQVPFTQQEQGTKTVIQNKETVTNIEDQITNSSTLSVNQDNQSKIVSTRPPVPKHKPKITKNKQPIHDNIKPSNNQTIAIKTPTASTSSIHHKEEPKMPFQYSIEELLHNIKIVHKGGQLYAIAYMNVKNYLDYLVYDKNHYPLNTLIEIAKIHKASWEYILNHLIAKRDNPYTANEIVQFLNEIKMEYLNPTTIEKLNEQNWSSADKSLLKDFELNIKLAPASSQILIQTLKNCIKPKSTDENIVNLTTETHNLQKTIIPTFAKTHNHLSNRSLTNKIIAKVINNKKWKNTLIKHPFLCNKFLELLDEKQINEFKNNNQLESLKELLRKIKGHLSPQNKQKLWDFFSTTEEGS